MVAMGSRRRTSLIALHVILLLLCWSHDSKGQSDDEDVIQQPINERSREAFASDPRDLGATVSKILNDWFATGYDKRVRPAYGGPPVTVNVSMHIVDISSVSEVLMDFTSDFYFRQRWFDDRLKFSKDVGLEELTVGAEVIERIWVPDTFFANEKSAYFHVATKKNTFIRITNDGRIYRSMRLTVTASCPMDLQYFPMDRQKCTIEVESCEYNDSSFLLLSFTHLHILSFCTSFSLFVRLFELLDGC